MTDALRRLQACGDPAEGFAKYACPDCGTSVTVPFSCKARGCPSCARKRALLWGRWLTTEVLLQRPHRHWVLTMPPEIRALFRTRRGLLTKLLSSGAWLLRRHIQRSCPNPQAVAGVIAVLQTWGDTLNWNPHLHLLATRGCLAPNGRWYPAGYTSYKMLARAWREVVLNLLVRAAALSRPEADNLRRKYKKGFLVYGGPWSATDNDLPRRTAEYLARPPLSDGRIAGYDPQSASALVHHKGLRPYTRPRAGTDAGGALRPAGSLVATLQAALEATPDSRGMVRITHDEVWDAEALLARWLQHVPARGQRYVHYQGLYSTRTRWRLHRRGWRFRLTAKGQTARAFGRHAWADLLWRVFQVDPLRCPSCGWTLVLVDIVVSRRGDLLVARPPPP